MANILKAKMAAVGREIDEIALADQATRAAFLFNYAVGVQLDELGRLTKTTRNGDTDTEYRNRIKAAAFGAANAGDGDSVITAAETYTGLDDAVLREIPPAGVEIRFYGQGYEIDPGAEKRVKTATAAGVTLNILMVPDATTAFSFAGGSGKGFGVGKLIAGYTA